jgi:hypothetical protein
MRHIISDDGLYHYICFRKHRERFELKTVGAVSWCDAKSARGGTQERGWGIFLLRGAPSR